MNIKEEVRKQIIKLEVQLEIMTDSKIYGTYELNQITGVILRQIQFLQSILKEGE